MASAIFDVEHAGNSQSSEEEAEKLKAVYQSLLGASFTDRDGRTRIMGVEDILVVSPFNAQVNLLTEMLPAGARVGTVDRFQGQEAPACLVSMATSSGEELPRGIDFLFSLNRLNVAISRAQALAVLFASPRLLDVACSTIEELKLVNALCAVRDSAMRTGR
jgi:superfamily I DNA and/or RNA helicase